jgi:glycerol-3-phosphate acyltransferase PlsX
MDRTQCVAVDMMGGDSSLAVTIPACLQFLQKHPKAQLCLVGDTAQFQFQFSQYSNRVDYIHTVEAVAMDAQPAKALRHQKTSSIHLMAQAVKEKKAQAGVSAGNTGALVAISKYILKTVPNIARPALMAQIPAKKKGSAWVLDLGANLYWEADQYLSFAQLAAESLNSKTKPTIGLLNIGTELIKGPEVLKEANDLLLDFQEDYNFDYKGFIEPNQIYSGDYDIILCNGLMGNIALKTAEGTFQFMNSYIKEQFTRTPWGMLVGMLSKPVFKRVKNHFSPSKRNGALLLGLTGIIIKSHGGTDVEGFVHAIQCAYNQIK